MTTFADMAFDLGGRPLGGSTFSSPWATHYFVDGSEGSAAFDGTAPSRSMSTISLAITAASRGDVIYVREKAGSTTDATDPTAYAENLTIPFAKHNLSIIGAGNNPWNPFYTQVKANAAGYGLKIQATSFRIENLDFNKGSATTGMIYFSGDVVTTDMAWGGVIANCHIRNADSAANAGIKTYAGSYNTIHNCDFEACHTGINLASGGTYPIRSIRIQDCRFKGANASAVGGANILGAGASNIIYELEILRCYFERVPTGAFIDLAGANKYGIIADCQFGDDDVSAGTSASNINKPTTVFLANCTDDSGALIAST